MLGPTNPRLPLPGALIGHECPRCDRKVELPLGDICGQCWADIERRAGRISRIVAVTTTAGMAVYVYLRMPDYPTARIVGLTAIVAWYVITALVTKRIMREALK